jgi:hypothetical protein
MANTFSKEEIVAFDQVLEGFQDALVMSRAFNKYSLDNVTAERTGDTIWRPEPYIALSYTGLDQSSNFARSYAQLSVPATIGYDHHVPLTLSALELRDALQEKRLGKAATQRLASDINVDCSNLAALTGTIVIKRTTAAAGFDDMAAVDTAMNRVGIDMNGRKVFLSSADYNGMASNLAGRGTFATDVKDAYTKAQVPGIAGFEAFKLDYAYRLAAKAGVTVTVNGANQRYVPVATTVDTNGGRHNVDNRFQTLAITVTSGTVKVGDAFTILGVNEVHHITKADTGSLKTFRVAAILTGSGGTGNIQISPPIIAADSSPTDPELEYKNVTAAPADGAAITFLNTVAAPVNAFWQDEAMEIIPGRYAPQEDSGLAVMTAETDNGIQVLMARQGAIGDLSTKYRWSVRYGLLNKQPEMSGIILFNQT